jgi:glycerol-3-phosphate dehydrogenase
LKYDVIVVGGGTTGVFTCLDLALRGVSVALLERGGLGSGTSGKFHGMLHSGARYVVNDAVAAVECAEENQALSRIASHVIADTGGLFVATTAEDAEYQRELEDGCRKCNVPYTEVPREQVCVMEPQLNPELKSALKVPDKVIRAHDLIFCASLTASMNGAKFYPYREVTGFSKKDGKTIDGVRAYDIIKSKTEDFHSDLIINAAGPWAGRLAQLAGVTIEAMSFAGAMGVVPARLCNHVVNRMRPPSDGDIVIPYGDNYSIVGTTATLVDDPDKVELSKEDLDLLIDEGSQMFPALRNLGFRRTFASVRPWLKVGEENEEVARKVSRTYEIFDHELDGVRGLITISGGKLTTCRLMGEQIADLAAEKLGVTQPSRTRDTALLGSRPDKDAQEISKAAHIDYGFVKRIMDTVGTVDEERYMPAIRLLMSYAFSEAR